MDLFVVLFSSQAGMIKSILDGHQCTHNYYLGSTVSIVCTYKVRDERTISPEAEKVDQKVASSSSSGEY